MYALDFPSKFIHWVMNCIDTVKFIVTIMEYYMGALKGKGDCKKGIASLLLFVIYTEYFTRIMGVVEKQKGFRFKPKCHIIPSKLHLK